LDGQLSSWILLREQSDALISSRAEGGITTVGRAGSAQNKFCMITAELTLSSVHEIGPASTPAPALLHLENRRRVSLVLPPERLCRCSSKRMSSKACLERSRVHATSSHSSKDVSQASCSGRRLLHGRGNGAGYGRVVVYYKSIVVVLLVFLVAGDVLELFVAALWWRGRRERVSGNSAGL